MAPATTSTKGSGKITEKMGFVKTIATIQRKNRVLLHEPMRARKFDFLCPQNTHMLACADVPHTALAEAYVSVIATRPPHLVLLGGPGALEPVKQPGRAPTEMVYILAAGSVQALIGHSAYSTAGTSFRASASRLGEASQLRSGQRAPVRNYAYASQHGVGVHLQAGYTPKLAPA